MEDSRNVVDKFKGWPHQKIVEELDRCGVGLHIAVENIERDYNMGTIVRSANAFGVRHVHIIGRRQWNKRGAMMTDKYLHVHYYPSVQEFVDEMKKTGRLIVAIENNVDSKPLSQSDFPLNCVLVFGSEANGISQELLRLSDEIRYIEQLGSTRSLNVGVAAGIAMYQWLKIRPKT